VCLEMDFAIRRMNFGHDLKLPEQYRPGKMPRPPADGNGASVG
jgi:hypothetical protein